MLAREKKAPASYPVRGGARLAALLVAGGAAVLGLGACDEPSIPPIIRTLDGPTAITFTCYGRMRVTNGAEANADQAIVDSAMPAGACETWDQVPASSDSTDDPQPPPGQGALESGGDQASWKELINVYGFVLQKQQGTLAVVQVPLGASQSTSGVPGAFGLIDADRFSPGKNAIPVGTLPVGLVTDPTGCHVMTANAGSCDLSILDVGSALDFDQLPQVQRVAVVNAAGERIGAKPRAVAGQPGNAPVGFECAADPDSLVYVAYPDCNLVAAVHAGTGEIRAGIVFHEDGTAELTDGSVSCGTMTCGGLVDSPAAPTGPDAAPVAEPDAGIVDAGIVDAGAGPSIQATGGAPRPVALFSDEVEAGDGSVVRRLYIGADNSPQVTVIELDEAYLPAESWSVPLEGEVGITALAATGPVRMGGDDGTLGGGGFGELRFVYAIATDKTVRVAEVESRRRECDTQIDPRYLHDVRDGSLLACLPAGDPTLPRRAGAVSPGIHLPNDALPLGVSFAAIDGSPDSSVSPLNLIGHFAFITMSTGGTLVVNVDDDRYADYEDPDDPLRFDISLAMAHQVRDAVSDRGGSLYCRRGSAGDAGVGGDECDYEAPVASCGVPNSSISTLGPRLGSAAPGQIINPAAVSVEKLDHLPSLRQVTCRESALEVPVSELSYMAPDYLRAYAYPDLESVGNETWTLTWEGRISRGAAAGSSVRLGYVSTDGAFELRDGSAPFCRMGAAPYDMVTLVGCDPGQGNSQCKTGEICYVHPEAPATITTGMCLPEEGAEELAEPCRDLLTSRRRFTVLETHANRLVLGQRRRALRTTPVDGCTGAAQCAALHAAEQALASEDEAVDLCLPADAAASPYTWACEADPTRAPGPDRCLMTCEGSSDCEEGLSCSGGYCVEGVIPPAQCLGALQRYDVRVSDAFAAKGSITGFLHQRMADPETGMCIDDPAAHPLDIGRLPLVAPACPTGDISGPGELDTAGALVPNPCAVTVSHAEQGDQEQVQVRETTAIRFRNPMFTLHLVDPVLGATCGGDPPEVAVPSVFLGYQISFPLVGGFIPLQVAASAQTPSDFTYEVRYPVSITRGPLGGLWIMDQGDTSSAIKGQVLRMDPGSPGSRVPGIQ